VANVVLCCLCHLFFVLCPVPAVVHDICPRLCPSLDRFSTLVVLPSAALKNATGGLSQICMVHNWTQIITVNRKTINLLLVKFTDLQISGQRLQAWPRSESTELRERALGRLSASTGNGFVCACTDSTGPFAQAAAL